MVKREVRNRVKAYLRSLGKRYLTPSFIVILCLSFFLWYIIKLCYTYTAEMPFRVNVDGEKFRVVCVVESTGNRILSHRYLSRRSVNLHSTDLQLTPSPDIEGEYIITPVSLQSAISLRYGDIKILSVGEIPPIELKR